MSLREKLNNNPAVATGGAVIVLLLCLGLIMCTFMGGGGSSVDIVYYDTEAKQLKLVKYTRDTTLDSPLAGTETYRAQLMTCGECVEVKDGESLDEMKAKDMHVAYLMRDNPQPSAEDFMESMQFREVDGTKWVNADSNAGAELVNRIQKELCRSGTPRQCGAKPRTK